jgi:hypothetical protein
MKLRKEILIIAWFLYAFIRANGKKIGNMIRDQVYGLHSISIISIIVNIIHI